MTLSLRNETPGCAAPNCGNPCPATTTGRPARYCSKACRARAHRHRHASVPAVAEVARGSATSRGRPEERSWLVQIRRGDHCVIVTIGLRRAPADRLAEKINNLLGGPDLPPPRLP